MGDAAKRTVGTGINQIPDMRNFSSLLGINGFQDIPNITSPLVIQWGFITSLSTGAGQTIIFPKPFPTACVFVIPILVRPGSTNTGSAETSYLASKSATQAVITKGGSETYAAYYLAIGY